MTAAGFTPGPATPPTSPPATRAPPPPRLTSSSPHRSRGPTGCLRWKSASMRCSSRVGPSATTAAASACRLRTRRCVPGTGCSGRPHPATRSAPIAAVRSTSPTRSTVPWPRASTPTTAPGSSPTSGSSIGSGDGSRASRLSPARRRRDRPPRSTATTCSSTPSSTPSPRPSVATSPASSRSRSARCRPRSSAPTTSATRCTRASPTTSTTTRASTPR